MYLAVNLIVVFVGLLFTAGFAFAVVLLAASYYYCFLKGEPLNTDLGFRHGTAWLNYPSLRGYVDAVCIMSIDEGGVFERAGFRVGDVLPDVSVIGLYRLLHSRRGQVAELSVVDGGPGPPFLQRPRRVIRVLVPGIGTKGSSLDGQAARGS